MANIGDLLGNLDLSQFADGEEAEDAVVESAAETGPAAPSSINDDDGAEAPLTPDEVAMAAVLQEATLEPDAAHPSLDLRDPAGLDLDDLGLYSVVSTIERELHIQLADADVAEWTTLGDLLDAVRTVSQN